MNLQPAQSQIAVRTVSIVTVASLALALAGLTWRLTGWDDGRTDVAVAAALPTTPGGTDAEVAAILGLAPFGSSVSTASGMASADGLGLVLKGVMMVEPGSASTALIATGDGPAALYGLGQSVGGAVIQSIGMDHVVLSQAGQPVRLDFPPASAATLDIASASTAPTAPPAAPPLSQEAQAALAGASPIATAAAAAARAAPPLPPVSGPPPDIGQAARTVGAVATPQGYRVGANPSPELRRFGLRPGDVIESVNGQAVGAGAGDERVLEQARSEGSARVVILRDGRRSTLSVSLR